MRGDYRLGSKGMIPWRNKSLIFLPIFSFLSNVYIICCDPKRP